MRLTRNFSTLVLVSQWKSVRSASCTREAPCFVVRGHRVASCVSPVLSEALCFVIRGHRYRSFTSCGLALAVGSPTGQLAERSPSRVDPQKPPTLVPILIHKCILFKIRMDFRVVAFCASCSSSHNS